MEVAIVGFGVEGVASAAYYTGLGHRVTVCDADSAKQVPQKYARQLGPRYLENLDRFDIIVRSAGIAPGTITATNPAAAQKITTAVDEFLRVCPTKHTIGITGTKGKGTTSTLVAKMVEAAGKKVFLGGNIGRSPLEFLPELTADDWVVLELSSFQLCDVRHSTHLATCLMVVPEHLNWHANMADYIRAKSQLFAHQTSDDIAIFFADNENSEQIAASSSAQKIPYFAPPGAYVDNGYIVIEGHKICALTEIKLLGTHNWQNVCAAVTTVWYAGVREIAALRAVATSFSGLEHRLELVRELDGVRYYDDSFGTTPETAMVALQAFAEPKVVILGGSDKGASFDELAAAVQAHNVRRVILIGQQAAAIRKALEQVRFDKYEMGGTDMSHIVRAARAAARPGDVVLLSTACASFDMFTDYKDRARQFTAAVQSLV